MESTGISRRTVNPASCSHIVIGFRSGWFIAVLALAWCWAGVRGLRADTLEVPGEFATIQAAIDAATTGDLVEIADGTYTGAGNRDIDFKGKAINVRSVNGADQCTIDCEFLGRAFQFISGEDEQSVVEGLTIRNGFGSPDGGGILIIGSSPTIRSCTITQCGAEANGGGIAVINGTLNLETTTLLDNFAGDLGNGDGGGAYVLGNAVFEDSFLDSNRTTRAGGGLFVSGIAGLVRTSFHDNSANADGGGIENQGDLFAFDCDFDRNTFGCLNRGGGVNGGGYFAGCTFRLNSTVCPSELGTGGAVAGGGTFVDCLFEQNNAITGGAVFGVADFENCDFLNNACGAVAGSSSFYFEDCTFQDNAATCNDISNAGGAVEGDGTFINCVFERNEAGSPFAINRGGAVSGSGEFTDCTFRSNRVQFGRGGAVAGSGTFLRCTFEDNEATWFANDGVDETGGAVWCDSDSSFTDCTFTNNRSVDLLDGGGAIWVQSGQVTMDGSSFTLNTAASAGGAIRNFGTLDLSNSSFCDNLPDNINGAFNDLGGNSLRVFCTCLELEVTNVIAGQDATFTVRYGTPGEKAVTVYGFESGVTSVNDVSGYCATFGINGVKASRVIGGLNRVFDGNGEIHFMLFIPEDVQGTAVLFQSAQRNTCPNECISNVISTTVQ